jgi:hypothetical protein
VLERISSTASKTPTHQHDHPSDPARKSTSASYRRHGALCESLRKTDSRVWLRKFCQFSITIFSISTTNGTHWFPKCLVKKRMNRMNVNSFRDKLRI